MTARVIQGDCLEVMPTLDAESIDAIVCDPPYGLSFMGKAWDHGVPGVPFWVEAIRVAKPGAYLLAFGGTRTFHRLTCAIEDAGWEIRDCLSWLYGSGFPKSLDVSKAIDAGCLRDGTPRHPVFAWKGWGTALKPAWEPIILARKPFKQTVAANVQEHGTGALNIDACRIEGVPRTTHTDGNRIGDRRGATGYVFGAEGVTYDGANGRWPANVCLDEEAAAMLDESAPDTGTFLKPGTRFSGGANVNAYGKATDREFIAYGDRGGASRFFYTAKAARSEREEGLEGLESRKCGLMEDDNYPIKTGSGNLRDTRRTNHHPTVKPVKLMRWLVRLATPPNGVVLDPFMGSGTTGIAAVLENKRFIGIEKESEYCAIAEKRIAHWGAQRILDLGGVA